MKQPKNASERGTCRLLLTDYTKPIANWEYLVMSPFATTMATEVILHRLEVDADGLDIPESLKTGPPRQSWLPSTILFSAAAVAIAVVLWQVLARWKRK